MDSVYVDRVLLCRVSPFGNLRIEAYLQLPEAYRSLSRPSSAPDAKAFPLRSFLLDLIPHLSWGQSRSGSLSSNYAGFRVSLKLFVLPFFQKVPQIILCFPLLLALHTFGYFVQFSRCLRLLLKPDSNTRFQMLESILN